MNANKVVERILKNGGVGVLPTDTIYGIVGSALSRVAVARIYKLRKRNPKKPMIVLISSLSDLKKFAVRLTPAIRKILKKYWPGKVSVILPCTAKKFSYLHRGTKTLAFRLPADLFAKALASAGASMAKMGLPKFNIRKLLNKTGPLVAPSVNLEGKSAAATIKEAKKYFGDKVDFYIDVGKIAGKPSSLFSIQGKRVIRLR